MKLDKFIEQNMEGFSSSEPPPGHIERFGSRIDRFYSLRRREFRMNFVRIAAFVVFIFLVTSLFISQYRSFKNQEVQVIINDELVEAEKYYAGMLDEYYVRISDLRFYHNEKEKRQVLKELHEMDLQVELMKSDLRNNPDNEIIINAIISHYQIKMELMDNIIARVEKTDNSLL